MLRLTLACTIIAAARLTHHCFCFLFLFAFPCVILRLIQKRQQLPTHKTFGVKDYTMATNSQKFLKMLATRLIILSGNVINTKHQLFFLHFHPVIQPTYQAPLGSEQQTHTHTHLHINNKYKQQKRITTTAVKYR